LTELYFTDTPDHETVYEVGDRVDVFCDHDNEKGERIRGWLTGVIVQVDAKMVAIQFKENVYLTDGWMVPDHVLWCPKDSKQMRPYNTKKRSKPRRKV
jgi:hypothetical protein